MTKWYGPVPEVCPLCGLKYLEKEFYDAPTTYGSWACMCEFCFNSPMFKASPGKLGSGLGQKYEKQGDNWVKVAG